MIKRGIQRVKAEGRSFFFGAALLGAWAAAGCAAGRPSPDIAYFPVASKPAHVVHLKSFNSLGDLTAARTSWLDFFRGSPLSPFVEKPAGMAFQGESLYLCDTGINAVHVWNLATGEAKRLGLSGEVILGKPVDVAVDAQGTVYVADTGRAEVVVFPSGGGPARHWKPSDRKTFRPVALAVSVGKLYVADIAAPTIDVFSTDTGGYVRSIDVPGGAKDTKALAMGLAIDRRGRLVVSDMMGGRVVVLDTDGHVTRSMGQPGDRYGDLGKPKQLAVAPDGVLFIADSAFARVHLFNAEGQLLMLLGDEHQGLGATPMPVGVAIAPGLPASLSAWVPAGFDAKYYLFVANLIGTKHLSLFAVGVEN